MSEHLTCIAMEIEAPRSDFMPWFQSVQRNSRDQIEWSIGRVGPEEKLKRLGRMILATAFPDPRPPPAVPFDGHPVAELGRAES